MMAATFQSLLQTFFTDHLLRQRQASPHTIAGYRDTFRLLFRFATVQLGKTPSTVNTEDVQPAFIGRFLEDLEQQRGNSSRTRNARWPRFTRSFGMSPSRNRRMRCCANRSSPCPASGISVHRLRSSMKRRSRRCWPRPICRRGLVVAIAPCWPSLSKPVCVCRN